MFTCNTYKRGIIAQKLPDKHNSTVKMYMIGRKTLLLPVGYTIRKRVITKDELFSGLLRKKEQLRKLAVDFA